MRFYEAESVVDATPTAVWSVLVDAGSWPAWDSGVTGVDGEIALGNRITIRSSAAPGRSFPVKVTTFDAPRTLVFTGGMPLGLFRGVRTYTITAEAGGTRFRMREEYSGPMLGLIWRSMPDLQPSFDRFAAGIAARAESESTIGG
ncbi:MAG TPA: SRPBCC domain-containing protein [Amnibacterium sp.]